MKKSDNILLIISLFVIISIFNSCKPKPESEPEQEQEPQGYINGYGWVDLGLPSGLKWATCNVGAYSPEEYGNYYAWGETITKPTYKPGNSTTYGEEMSDISGNTQYDAARANWGSSWRLPTKEELEELDNNCTYQLTNQGGKNGYKVTGPNGNYIFLPTAGSESYPGTRCEYWSSTPDIYYNNFYAYSLDIYQGNGSVNWYVARHHGLSIRPVSD